MPHVPTRTVALFVGVLALLAAVGPTVDALVFGLHDHVVEFPRSASGQVLNPVGNAHTTTPHHCELSANPAERAAHAVLAAPSVIAWMVTEPSLPTLRGTPFAPSAPPRA